MKKNKTAFIIIRLTEEEKELLKKDSKDSKNLSSYIRSLLNLDD